MENVLEELSFSEPVAQQDDQQEKQNAESQNRAFWRKFEMGSDYDRGTMFAGSVDGDGTIRDFITKLILLLVSLAKNDNVNANKNQKIFDITKAALELYQETINAKPDKIKDHAKFVAAMQGFMDQFVATRRYGDRL